MREYEYNDLTKQLLNQGYTADNHPDYVRVCTSRWGKNPLQNLAGGFEYEPQYRDAFVYATGCGKHVMGQHVIDNMSFMGVNWIHENDNPVVRCPYDKPNCKLNDSKLHGMQGGGFCIQCWCVCHRTDKAYYYENSIEKANKERELEKNQKYQEYADSRNGRVCYNHMHYDERTRSWAQIYEPNNCARRCTSTLCPILGRDLNRKKGNVYYDIKTSYTRNDHTIFDGEQIVNIKKGVRFFEKTVSLDICEAFIKLQSGEIYERYINENRSSQSRYKDFKTEVLNIRMESRPSRDLMKDLEDIRAGCNVTHESDTLKHLKEAKRQRKNTAEQKKIEKLEKLILKVGYYNLEDGREKYRIDKLFEWERIMELEAEREKREKEKQNEPVQLSLFD